ncbi:hypothetical protein FKP32DRAFT_175704 [Trametes sanguinea]|nr:hypothetical protein FKP32DRAFT_175704 [Trametes sanguinea]
MELRDFDFSYRLSRADEVKTGTSSAPLGHPPAEADRYFSVGAQGDNAKSTGECRFEEMPWDILIEIFLRVGPCDLLSLARTAKALRGFLMSRSSAHIWKASRQRVSLTIPDCPPELSEPQYIVLLFTSECTLCGEPGIMNADWKLLGRYCPSCLDRDLVHRVDIDKLLHAVYSTAGVWEPFLLGDSLYSSVGMCTRKQVAEFQNAWEACHTPLEKSQLVMEYRAKYQLRKNFVRDIEDFALAEEARRRKRLARIRENRVRTIINRLSKAGWKPELRHMTLERIHDELCQLDIVYKTVPLTEDAWNGMQAALTDLMNRMRACRLRDEWMAAVRSRLQWLHEVVIDYNLDVGRKKGTAAGSDLRVEFSDVALFHEVRTLLEAPPADDVKKESIAKLCDEMLPTLQERWIQEHQPHFDDLVKQTPRASSLSENALATLAIVTFDCKQCRCKSMRWPHVLAHNCERALIATPIRWITYKKDSENPPSYTDILASFCHEHQLTPPCRPELSLKVRFAPESTEDMIRACGYDPLTATYAELRDCGVRLYCSVCAVPSVGYAETYNWQNATCHSQSHCGAEGHGWEVERDTALLSNWKILDAESTALVVALEAAERQAGRRAFMDEVYQCMRCSDQASRSIVFHCMQFVFPSNPFLPSNSSLSFDRRVHQVQKPEIGRDFYVVPKVEDGVWHDPILVYHENARANRKAARDVKRRIAVFSPSLFQDSDG